MCLRWLMYVYKRVYAILVFVFNYKTVVYKYALDVKMFQNTSIGFFVRAHMTWRIGRAEGEMIWLQ
jgi:hypothetical protein